MDIICSKRTSADRNFKFLILGCGYKIQVKRKPTVINALNKSRYVFFTHNKLHNVNIILLDTSPGVTNAFPDASVG